MNTDGASGEVNATARSGSDRSEPPESFVGVGLEEAGAKKALNTRDEEWSGSIGASGGAESSVVGDDGAGASMGGVFAFALFRAASIFASRACCA